MPQEKEKPSTWRQVLPCFAVCHFSMSMGFGSGFSGVALPQLQDEKVAGFTLTENQVSWFASIQAFAMIVTCALGGVMGQCVGRKYSLMLIAPLYSSGFICLAVAEDPVLLLCGRFVCGVAAGLASGPTATYISEVSTPNLRTSLGSGNNGSFNLGIFLIFTFGSFLHWRILAWVSALIPLLGLFWLCFIPESPVWLVAQGRYDEAKESLTWLRGEDCDNTKEFLDLKESCQVKDKFGNPSVREKAVNKWKQLTRRDVSKPFGIILITAFLQQFSGMSSISFYAMNILSEAGSSVNIHLVINLFGLLRFISQFVGSFLLLKFNCRHLMVVSCIFMSLALATLGVSFYLHDKYDLNDALAKSASNHTVLINDMQPVLPSTVVTLVGVLPMISFGMAALMFDIGLGPVPWSYMAEIFPLDVRSFMSGVGNSITYIYMFIAVKTFPSMVHAVTMAGVCWFYSGVSMVCILFTCFSLPETKGKDINEISKWFLKKISTKQKNAKNLSRLNGKIDSTEM